jgi:hypothetical protein
LRSLVSALFSASQRRLLLVVEDVEVIAQRDPSLLYFLLDAPLAARARVALLGLTSSVGLPGMLEKRFRSRLADRIVLLPPPSPLQLAMRLERALRLPPLRALRQPVQEGAAAPANMQGAAAGVPSGAGQLSAPVGLRPPAPRSATSAASAAYALYRRHWRASVVRVLCHPSFGLAHAAHPAACEAGFTLSAADYTRRLLQAVVALQVRLALAAATAQQLARGGAGRAVLAFPLLSIFDVPPLLPAPGLSLVPSLFGSSGGRSSGGSHAVPALHPWLRLPAGMARHTVRAAALPADAGVEACLAPLSALPSPHLCLLVAMAHIEVRDRHKGVAGAGAGGRSAASAAAAAAAAAAGLAPGPSAAALASASSADGQALSPGAVEGGGARYNFNRVFHELRSAMSDGSGGTSAITAAIRAGQSGATEGRGALASTGAAASAAPPVASTSSAARHLPEKGTAIAAFRQCVTYGLVRLLPPASSTGAAGAGTLSSRVLGSMEGAARGGIDGDGRAASGAAADTGRGSAAGVASLATSAALWSGRELAVGSLAGVGLEHAPCRLLLDPDALLATLRGRQGAAVLAQVDAAVRSFLVGAGRVAPGSL